MSVAYSVATGEPLLGWPVERRAKVLYVDAELPIGLVQTRLRAFGPPPPNFFILSMEHLYRQGASLPDLATSAGQEFFDKLLEERKPELVILDPLTALIRSGAENEAESWAPVQNWMLKQRFRGRTILLAHHEGKTGKQRGTSKREDVLDVMVGLKLRSDLASESETVFELNFTKARSFFGADATPRVMRLSTTSETVTWTHEGKEASKAERVAEMLEQGYEPSAIMDETGLTKGRISQIKKELIEAGRLATQF